MSKYAKLISVALAFAGTWVVLLGTQFFLTSAPTSQIISRETPTNPVIAVVAEALPIPKPQPKIFKIIIGGDVMLDRYIRKLGEQNGYDSLFANVAPLLQSADLAVVNLEGPITNYPSKTLLRNGSTTPELTFTFSPTSATALARTGIDLVSLANNHTDNFGLAGLSETKVHLQQAGLSWFGNPWNNPGDSQTICRQDICVAFIGYHEFREGFEEVLAEIKALDNQVDFVIVMPHWGEEYVAEPSERLKTKARHLVAAGADLIAGAHPHVVMVKEEVAGAPIFYSLGNFLFDQYFSAATMTGELLEIGLTRDEATDQVQISQILIHGVTTASRAGVTLSNLPPEKF